MNPERDAMTPWLPRWAGWLVIGCAEAIAHFRDAFLAALVTILAMLCWYAVFALFAF